jgi:hypothetical protein
MNKVLPRVATSVAIGAMIACASFSSSTHAETRFFGIGLKTTVGSGKLATESRNVASFDRIELRDGLQATLRQGSAPALSITADDNIVPFVETKSNGNTLIVGIKSNSNLRTKSPIAVAVTYTKLERLLVQDGVRADVDTLTAPAVFVKVSDGASLELKGIAAAEAEVTVSDGATARVGEVTKAERQRYRVSDGARLTLDSASNGRANVVVKDGARFAARALNASHLDVAVSDGSSAQLVGNATEQTYKLSDGASLDARDLRGASASAKVSDSGSLDLGSLQKLDLQVGDGGSVRYSGDPQLTVKKSDGGSVRRY